MSNQKIDALYIRLSQEDEREGDSNSVQNRKESLAKYASEHGFTNPRFFVDDGYSGVNFQRPGFQEMMREAEAGNVSTIITKDFRDWGGTI